MLVLAGVIAAVATLGWPALSVSVANVVDRLVVSSAHALTSESWLGLGCLVAVAVLYHVASAMAARAAAGTRMPFRGLFAAQFAASAANRITPGGLGSATVNVRYFQRRGQLTAQRSVAAIAVLAVMGAVADIAAFGLLIALAALVGAHAAVVESWVLLRRALTPLSLPTGGWTALGAALATLAVALLCRRSRAVGRRVADSVTRLAADFRLAIPRPAALIELLCASAATTLLLATGFAIAATVPSAGLPAHDFLTLVVGYMVASAAASSIPTPGGLGAADAALVGVLVVSGAPAGFAIGTVLAFRLVTFWGTALVGLAAARTLRRDGAI